jgi:hypothetical protein
MIRFNRRKQMLSNMFSVVGFSVVAWLYFKFVKPDAGIDSIFPMAFGWCVGEVTSAFIVHGREDQI